MTEGKRILVINDTQEILELFETILTDLGHHVILMSYAPDELTRIEELKPDLVIADFIFGPGEKTGWQLLQKMRMNRSTERIPIIACTASVQAAADAEGYLLQQRIALVLKPFTISQLEDTLRKVIETERENAD
ncbi:MAG: response regulator [Candidatus Limnocylindria bacterium]